MDRSTLIRLDDALPIDAAPRLDIYGGIHKALRAFMSHVLGRLGACDAADADQLAGVLGEARELLALMRSHVEHENAFVHAAMERRAPGSAAITADEHVEHEAAIAALVDAIDALGSAPAAHRAALLQRLYLRFARFVAENLEHMEIEETHNTAVMRDAYCDSEIGAMLRALHASIPPQEAALVHRWLFVAMNHDERVGMLSGMREAAPAPVFEAEIGRARELLSPRDWAKLARALDLPAVAGLVEVW
ncbi:MAG TPA: hypothetical protein VEA81_12925 [Burkholderiaceae bacterium]|nr:hypothetical protein [Burkholderiaceae bacterium]